MPRDSLGSFSLPAGTLVNTGDTVLVAQHNPFAQDVAQALTNSLDRGGKGGMQADLPMNGHKVTNLADGVADTDAATVGQLAGAGSIPIGVVLDYWGATPPSGWLFPVGQAVSRTTYAALFAVIGTSAGAGDGSTTFNLPDYRAAVSAGKADMGGTLKSLLSNFAASTLGAIFGEQAHTLTTGEMPSHTHTVNDPQHAHTGTPVLGGAGNIVSNGSGMGEIPTTTGFAPTGITINNAGGGGAHNNVQPTIICNKILKVA